MSYKNKLANYQGDCKVELGIYTDFSDYIKKFSYMIDKNSSGVDIGAGPGGCNGKYFDRCHYLDGCDADMEVVKTIPDKYYNNKFFHVFGRDNFEYDDESLDFAISSCVIQHLNSFNELKKGINEVSRILKRNGLFYLMFKAGTNDTTLTHYNEYYNEMRTFRVFHPINIIDMCKTYGLITKDIKKLIDENWIPYCCIIFTKVSN